MYLIIKAACMDDAIAYAQRRFKPKVGNDCPVVPEEHIARAEYKVWASNAWLKEAVVWFNEGGTNAPFPDGTLLHFSADQS